MFGIASCSSLSTGYPVILDDADFEESLINRGDRAASVDNRAGAFGGSDAFAHFRRALDGAGECMSGYFAGMIPGEDGACAGLRVEMSSGFFGSIVHLCKKLVSWIFDGEVNRQIRTLFRNAVEGVLARCPGDGGQDIRKQLDTIADPASGWPLDLRDIRSVCEKCSRATQLMAARDTDIAPSVAAQARVDDALPLRTSDA